MCTHNPSVHSALDSSIETPASLLTELSLKKRMKKKPGTFGDTDINMTWGKKNLRFIPTEYIPGL